MSKKSSKENSFQKAFTQTDRLLKQIKIPKGIQIIRVSQINRN